MGVVSSCSSASGSTIMSPLVGTSCQFSSTVEVSPSGSYPVLLPEERSSRKSRVLNEAGGELIGSPVDEFEDGGKVTSDSEISSGSNSRDESG